MPLLFVRDWLLEEEEELLEPFFRVVPRRPMLPAFFVPLLLPPPGSPPLHATTGEIKSASAKRYFALLAIDGKRRPQSHPWQILFSAFF